MPIGPINPPEYEEAYLNNRAKSFVHYWCYLIENLRQVFNMELFKEVLANDFELRKDSEYIDNVGLFEEWLKGLKESLVDVRHGVEEFVAVCGENGVIVVNVKFVFVFKYAQNVEAGDVTVRESIEWVLENNIDERFPRVKRMNVKLIRDD